MKIVRNEFILLVLFAVLVLPACTPIPNSVDPQNALTQEGLQGTVNQTDMAVGTDPAQSAPSIPEFQPVTPQVAETSLPTNTPEPSPTARPYYDINDPTTWPQEMQDYINRPIREWNDPMRTYMSDEAFNTQLKQMRRDFLSKKNISGAETISENDLFTAYVRWGMEYKGEMLRLSPLEKTRLITGPFRPSYNDGNVIYPGTQVSFQLGLQGVTQEALDFMQSDEYSMMNTHIFGNLVHLERPPYAGVIGTLVGLVEPIGLSTDNAVECLIYYEQNNQGYWALINIPLKPTQYLPGDEYVALDGGGYRTYKYAVIVDRPAIRLGLGTETPTLQDFIDNVGKVIWLKDGGPSSVQSIQGPVTRVETVLTVTGIESANSVVFDLAQPEVIDLPWN